MAASTVVVWLLLLLLLLKLGEMRPIKELTNGGLAYVYDDELRWSIRFPL